MAGSERPAGLPPHEPEDGPSSSSGALLAADSAPFDTSELARALRRVVTTGSRAGLIGFMLRGGLHALTALAFVLASKLRRSSKGPQRKRELSWTAALQDTLKYTAFLAALGTVYVSVDESLAGLFGKDRSAKWRALVAGAVAGQTLLITGSETRQYSLGTYVLLRGLTLVIRTLNKPGGDPRLRALLAPTRMEHGDTALMCVSAAQIVYAFIMMPSTLPRSYVRFISKHGAKEAWVWKAVQEQALRNYQGEEPGPLNLLRGTPYASLQARIPCQFYHPGQTCTEHAVCGIPSSYMRSLGVYGPMYLVTALLVHRQKLLKQPHTIWPKVAAGIARSSLFLTLYITLAFSGVCIGFNTAGTSTGMLIASSVWIGGLATLVEKKSRRMELALYCLSRALESGARCLGEWGAVDASLVPSRLDVLLFSVGCAAIMNAYSGDNGKHRDVFKSKYLNVLDFVFGNTGLDAGRIRHYPSNHDILRVASMRIRTYSGRRLADLDREPGAAPGARQAQGQGQGRQLGHRLQNGQSPAGPGTGPGAAAAAAGGGSASAGGLLQALLPASLLQRIGIRGNGAAAAAGTAGPGMRASQSTAMLDQPGEALPAAAAEGQGPATLWRRSFTDPCFGPCEGRVHGADRGIRNQTLQLHGEPSLSDLHTLLLPRGSPTCVESGVELGVDCRAAAAGGVVDCMGGPGGVGLTVTGAGGAAGEQLLRGSSCELCVDAAEELPDSPRWGTLWQAPGLQGGQVEGAAGAMGRALVQQALAAEGEGDALS